MHDILELANTTENYVMLEIWKVYFYGLTSRQRNFAFSVIHCGQNLTGDLTTSG